MKEARRTAEVSQKRLHVPAVDRSSLGKPPVLVAVVGPPKVGKTTLIKSIVKSYTSQNVTNVQGPITLLAGKDRRITFIEAPNDLNGAIDVAKVADLVLLLVDANFGFEMETFEFLNILQAHGFPKILGVLTHMDMFTKMSQIKKTKKEMKKRFWEEIYPGAKMFHLSGKSF